MAMRPRKPVTTPASRERRVAVRVSVDTYIRAAVAHEASGRKVHGWVRNLSGGGMFVETPDRLPEDAPVRIDALARCGAELIHFKAGGWVAYSGPDGLGLQFEALDEGMAARLATLLERFSGPPPEPGVGGSPTAPPGSGIPDPA
jgi:hypothetical protein